MDQQTLLNIMTVFVIIAGVAMVVQMAVMIGIYRAARHTSQQLASVLPKIETLLETSQKAIDQGRSQIMELTTRTNDLLDTARLQLTRVDELLADASQRARVQLEKAELVIEDALGRAQQTISVVHSGVMRPLREIRGIAAGLKTAVAYLAKGNRSSVAQATQDEEMFI